jgi:hypothetical protein
MNYKEELCGLRIQRLQKKKKKKREDSRARKYLKLDAIR